MLFCKKQKEKINLVKEKFNRHDGLFFSEVNIICESCCNHCDDECESRIEGTKDKIFFKPNAY